MLLHLLLTSQDDFLCFVYFFSVEPEPSEDEQHITLTTTDVSVQHIASVSVASDMKIIFKKLAFFLFVYG